MVGCLVQPFGPASTECTSQALLTLHGRPHSFCRVDMTGLGEEGKEGGAGGRTELGRQNGEKIKYKKFDPYLLYRKAHDLIVYYDGSWIISSSNIC